MKIAELVGIENIIIKEADKFELLDHFSVWTTNEEREILKKLSKPVPLGSLSETDQFRIASMVRKSLVTKIGHNNPSVVANEKTK
jgi:hypothetical protein